MIIQRHATKDVEAGLSRQAAVGLLGPHQVGKTTLALEIAKKRPAIYLDLEKADTRARLSNFEQYLTQQAGKLVILDEIQQMPEVFRSLRGLIDEGRRSGRGEGQFLVLGSASLDLLRQSSESLAGRITYVELSPLHVDEVDHTSGDRLWLRGGFPKSFLAQSDEESMSWRQDFIRTYLERDIPLLGPRIPAETLRRFWTMLAHVQGSLMDSSRIAGALAISGQSVTRYLDLMVDLLLVRRLPAWSGNVGKRLVRSPKTYVRDSGLAHALLGLHSLDQLLGHPVAGASWEGLVIETLVAAAPRDTEAYFYRTAAGAEVDLLLAMPGGALWAIEIKRTNAPKVERGFHVARQDLKPLRSYVAYSGDERFPLRDGVEAISVRELASLLRAER